MLRSDTTTSPAPARLPDWRAALARDGSSGAAPTAGAANDNFVPPAAPPADPAPAPASGALLRAALEHFAATGLGSAEAALSAAEQAAIAADHSARDHWLALAALFDRRRAAALRERLAPRAP